MITYQKRKIAKHCLKIEILFVQVSLNPLHDRITHDATFYLNENKQFILQIYFKVLNTIKLHYSFEKNNTFFLFIYFTYSLIKKKIKLNYIPRIKNARLKKNKSYEKREKKKNNC